MTPICRVKSKQNFHWSKNEAKNCFRDIKSLFSFSTAKIEKNTWNKLKKTKLVVWWFDVTNKVCKRDINKNTIWYATSVIVVPFFQSCFVILLEDTTKIPP